jgi:hypothetical protein
MIDPLQHQQELTHVAQLSCIECRRLWIDASERWRIYLSPDAVPEPVLYCADCASYEFDA